MLLERYMSDELYRMLASKESYKPFPAIEDREYWNHLDDSLVKRIIKEGEKYLNMQWPTLSAVRYMDYMRTGYRQQYQDLYFERRDALNCLVLAECVENKKRFIDDIINGIWSICEESSWTIPAHNELPYSQYSPQPLPDIDEPIIDLFAAETGGILSVVYYVMKTALDEVSYLICKRLVHEVTNRIISQYHKHDDFWWMGFITKDNRVINNWNPWINSNCLLAFLLVENQPQRRTQLVAKCLRSLDKFLSGYQSDGGCDEGPIYWNHAGGSLFDCLELLYSASNKEIDIYNESLIKEIGRFILKVHVSEKSYVNFADSAAKIDSPGDLIYRFGCRIGDTMLSDFGAFIYNMPNNDPTTKKSLSLYRKMCEVVNYKYIKNASQKAPYLRDVWLDGIQLMAARESEGTNEGFYLAAKGGHNNESHNHNDVGQFIVYADGNPVIIDVGVGTYTSKTFSKERYDIWTMQSAYHNLPTINYIQQSAGHIYKAKEVNYEINEQGTKLYMDISDAYPKEANILFWKRQFSLIRKEKSYVEIVEEFRLKTESDNISISFMTLCKPQLIDEGKAVIEIYNGNKIIIMFDSLQLYGFIECITLDDLKLQSIWGKEIFRITLKNKYPIQQGKWIYKFLKEK